jgi:hypothetical protein
LQQGAHVVGERLVDLRVLLGRVDAVELQPLAVEVAVIARAFGSCSMRRACASTWSRVASWPAPAAA